MHLLEFSFLEKLRSTLLITCLQAREAHYSVPARFLEEGPKNSSTLWQIVQQAAVDLGETLHEPGDVEASNARS